MYPLYSSGDQLGNVVNRQNATSRCLAAKLRFWGGAWQQHDVMWGDGSVVKPVR